MEASTAVSSRLIGAFFVEKGLVTQEQLELALQKQAASGERLGEIIVAEFDVSRLELASVLAEQWAEFERDSKARDEQASPGIQSSTAEAPIAEPAAAPVEPQLRRPIGEIFLERGFVTTEDLDRALDVQRESGTRLGEVLVEQGSLTRLDLASALAEQWSSLQKLRPPDPADPQPWQNGTPDAPTGQTEVPAELRRSVDDLAERVRAVEHASAATPWNEDLRLLADNVRAAIATVEERVTRTAARVDPEQLEALGTALDELRERVQEPAARLEAVERRLGELPSVEALEQRVETQLAELRAAVEASAVNPGPDDDLSVLRERLDELTARAVAPEDLQALRSEVAALAGGSSSADEVAVLRAAVGELEARAVSTDDLAALQARLDELALRAVVPEALAEVRAEVVALSRGSSADELAALRAAVDEQAARAVSAADLATLREAVDQLAASVASTDDLATLQARLDEMALRVVLPEALAEVRAEVAALAARPMLGPEALDELRDRLAAVADQIVGVPAADPELSERLAAVADDAGAARAELASLASHVAELSALRPRIDELAERLPTEDLEELRRGLDELSARVAADVVGEDHATRIAGLLARVEEIGTRVESIDSRNTEPSGPRLREILDGLRAEIGSLAQRPVVDAVALEGRLADLEQRGPDPAVESLAASVSEQRKRIDGRLDQLASRMVDPAVVDAVQAKVAEVADRVAAAAEADSVEARLVQLEQRLADTAPLDEIRAELGRLAGAVADERASMEHALRTRIDELGVSLPSAGDVADLRTRLDELGARPAVDDELRARVEELFERVEQSHAASEAHSQLREAVARLEATGAAESTAAGERLAGIENALASLDGVEWRLQTHLEESVAVRAGELEHRLEDTSRRLGALDALEARIEALRDDIASRPGSRVIDEVAAGLRSEVARLTERLGRQERAFAELPDPPDPTARIDDLALRLDGQARLAAERIGELGEGLRLRVDEVDERLGGLALRDEVSGSIAEHAASLAAELDAIRRASAEHEHSLAERFAGRDELTDAVESVRTEVASRVEESTGVLRRELDGRAAEIGEQFAAQREELTVLRSQLDELQTTTAGQEEWRGSVESALNDRIDGLEQRFASEATETRALVERTEITLRTEAGSLGTRLDELLGLRHSDLQAARAASDALAASVDELHGLRVEDTEAARVAAGELVRHIEGLADALRSESASASSAAQEVTKRVDELEGVHADDRESARLAGAELVARLDDLAIRTAAAAAEADRALRSDLYTLAATAEEKEAAGIEAREDLRVELERAAASMSWRLERIEEALSSDDGERLSAAVGELERRLEQQVAQQDEQVRVTERALRKGLASLGERLADTQTAYLDAGNALRRSIERLGAAVVEADARMADQIPVSEVDGYVAFAPTSEGYRLVQMPGQAPELGAIVEIEGIESQLVVTRFGRSPLPLDSRPCAYLDRT